MVHAATGRFGTKRWLIGVAAALSLMGAGAAQAITAPMLLVDVDSGKVIYQQGATDPWYPASITKLMTTYVALDLVRQGRVSLDTMVTISAAAAAEPPSKMGFRPGTQLTLDNALKIIMVKSANDVAYAIGESLGGSVEGFADLMNLSAQRLGMHESRWFNANGLPDPRQWTSARDMAVLGRALIRDFPGQRDLFSISAIQFGKAVMANHNGLLGRYEGADGMKTGFICSGGFNVVASATRNGRRILAIVMGQPSPRERDLKTADLFDYGFTQSTGWTSDSLEGLPTSANAAPPDMRPYICSGKKALPVDEGQGAISAGKPGSPDATNAQLTGGASGPASALAFATLNGASLKGRSLPPRAPLQPIAVWVGRNPAEGQTILAQQEAAEKAEREAARTAKLEAAKAKREAIRQARLEAKGKRDAAKAATRTAATTPADKKGGVPKSATAFASTDSGNGMPEAKPGAKPGAKKAAHGSAKPATSAAKGTKPAETKPTPKKAHAAKAGE